MGAQERFDLITRNTQEVLTPDDLHNFLRSGAPLKHYIGFEISGKIHMGTGIACMQKVKDFMDAGVETTIFLADWHTWINDKLGGDRDVIKRVAVGYFKEGMKASLKALGGNPEKLNFVLGSELYHHNDEYWSSLIEVAKNITLARIMRSIDILGRQEGQAVDFAKLLYPPMQVNDIFSLGVNIAHAGTDQRKAHVIARDVAPSLKKAKPVAVHHHLLLGLQKPPVWPIPPNQKREFWTAAKMSKSVPDSAIFIHDSPDEIVRKVSKAFCPPEETEFNPIVDWVEHLFLNQGKSFPVKRDEKFGGSVTYGNADELKEAYLSGSLHPDDLKKSAAEALVNLLEPVRKHFAKSDAAAMLTEIEKLPKEFQPH